MTRERRVMAGFGQALASFGMRMADRATEQLVHSEFIKGKALWEQSNSDFFESFGTEEDYLNGPAKYKKFTEQSQQEILAGLKTPGAQNALKDYFIAEGPDNGKILKRVMGGRLRGEELRNLWGAIQGTDDIQGFIPEAGADPEVLIQGIAEAEAAAQGALRKGYLTADAAEEGIIQALMADWPEVAIEKIEASKLDPLRKQQLISTANSYISRRIKAAKEADKLTTIQSYREMSKPILNGKLTYDDIDNSGLRETRRSGEDTSDADRWRKYIQGSYEDVPTKSSPEGHTVSFAAVYDAATLQLSPKEAYDVLLEARFNDRSITNEQFEWAVDKIENPYSRHTLEDLNATLKRNLEDFHGLYAFSGERDRNKKVNEALISWVDSLIKQNKVPSKKEMEAMSSAFRAGGGQPYDIGRTIEQGGWEWEIIGFDEDGTPIVDGDPIRKMP